MIPSESLWPTFYYMRRNAGVLERKSVVAFPMVRSPEGKTSTPHDHEARVRWKPLDTRRFYDLC